MSVLPCSHHDGKCPSCGEDLPGHDALNRLVHSIAPNFAPGRTCEHGFLFPCVQCAKVLLRERDQLADALTTADRTHAAELAELRRDRLTPELVRARLRPLLAEALKCHDSEVEVTAIHDCARAILGWPADGPSPLEEK